MHTCEALIVGGGPAGSTCARRLRDAGLDVIVLDKQAFPRDKTCAGWITPAVIEELQLDTANYAASRVFQPITGFRTGIIGGPAVLTEYDHPVSYAIRRCEFDHYLLERSGARLMLGQKTQTFERSNGLWIINGTIKSPLLIGAGGHFCPVARMIGGASTRKETVVAAQEIEYRMDECQLAECAVRETVPELYFCPDLQGYGWCVRKGEFLNIGLGREDNHRLADHAADFCRLMKRQGRIPRDAPEKLHGHAYILYGHARRRLAGDGVLLIGDAAGLAYPASGEGIRPAVESGLLAAEAIVNARGDYSESALGPYERQITRRFGKRAAAGRPSSPRVSRLKERAASFLFGTRWFSRHVLIERWFLHTHQQALTIASMT